MSKSETLLKLLLRVAGALCLLAIAAVVMPLEWMAVGHEWLGLGALPEGPIVEYLARSLSALYAILGGLMLLVAGDVRRYAAAITYLAATHLVLAAVILVTDISAGMPWCAAVCEVTGGAGFGLAVLLLQARIKGRP